MLGVKQAVADSPKGSVYSFHFTGKTQENSIISAGDSLNSLLFGSRFGFELQQSTFEEAPSHFRSDLQLDHHRIFEGLNIDYLILNWHILSDRSLSEMEQKIS